MSHSDRVDGESLWTSARTTRLLEWIEKNPTQLRFILTRKAHWDHEPHWKKKQINRDSEDDSVMTKVKCYRNASQAIFALDKDRSVRELLENNGELLDDRVKATIFRWKRKYDRINKQIRKIKPAVNLGEVKDGTQLYKDLAKYHSEFPFWGRLNAQWHNLPGWDEDVSKPTPAKKKRRGSRGKVICIMSSDDSDSGGTQKSQDNSEEEECNNMKLEPVAGGSNPNRRRIKRTSSSAAEQVERRKDTQKHENSLDGQKLELEIQKLKNEELRMKMKMDRQKGIQEERRHLQEALIGFIKDLHTGTDDLN